MRIKTVETPYKTKRNKFAICIFTFSGDESCLFQCIKALNKLKSTLNFDIHIIDDSNSPLENVPDGVFYSKSIYNRNGNLNGVECSHGELMELLRCSRKSNAEFVIKLDSDMIVKSFSNFLYPLKKNKNQVIGFKLNENMCYVSGSCYLIPSKYLYKTIKCFHSWFIKEQETDDFAPHCPEDWAVTRSICAINDIPMLQYINYGNSENWLLSPFNFQEIKTENNRVEINPLIFHRFNIYDFVNFGNRFTIKEGNSREIAGKCMEQFNDFLS